MGRTPRARSGRQRAAVGGQSRLGLPQRQRAAVGEGVFPLLVACVSTVLALLLFFSETVPALGEYRHLQEVEDQRFELDHRLFEELETESLHRIGLQIDPQQILLELDRRGVHRRDWPVDENPR